MDPPNAPMAQKIAQAVTAFEQQRTGHMPKSVTVLLSEDIVLITLRGALSPAEMNLARTPSGLAQVCEFHRQLFADASDSMRLEIESITGVEVREAIAEVEPNKGTMMKVFTSGTVVQLFLLSHALPAESWSGSDPKGQS